MVSLRGGIANTLSYDLAKIEERWGLRPDQMLDYKALKGDSTDNIPGIPGVGEKTASKLVATWGTLDNLYEHLDEVVPEKLRPLLAEYRGPGPREPRAHAARPRRGRAAGRPPRAGGGVRPRGRGPPVPRVRVPDAHRPPPAAHRRAARGRARGDARADARRASRPHKAWVGGRAGARRPGAGGGRGTYRGPTFGSSGRATPAVARLRLDRRRGAGGRPWPPTGTPGRHDATSSAGEARAETWRRRAGDSRRPRRGDRRSRPDRVSARYGVAGLEPWLRAQEAVGRRARRGRPTAPARGRRSRSPSPAPTGASSLPRPGASIGAASPRWKGSSMRGSWATRSSRC